MVKKGNIFTISVKNDDGEQPRQVNEESKPESFERAVTETGFGKYNILLVLLCLPATWAPIFESTTMSYIFSSAQCDLNLSLEDKGYLNSITYVGMISSGAMWGFLFDTLGRKKLLMFGFLMDAIFVFSSAFSQSIIPLMVFKFLGGLIINGPFSAMSSYLSEFHCSKYRPRIQLTIGVMNSLGTIALPLLAWAILTKSWEFSLFGGYLEFHSWNIYLFLCSLPALLSGLIFIFLPESPKFMMTVGENEKALKTFKKVYRINTGKYEDTFPVKELINETTLTNGNKYGGHVTANRTKIQAMKEGWQQITPLFHRPYLAKLILVCIIQMCFIQSINTLRLWLPQIFQAINDYGKLHNGTSTSLCIMLEELNPSGSENDCTVNKDNSSVYINSMIVAFSSTVAYILTATVITLIGKKKIIVSLGLSAAVVGASIYFSQDEVTTTALSALYIALCSVCSHVTLSAVVDMFPTTLRTLTIALTLMLGRIGAMTGNLLFPVLLRAGCGSPFFYMSGLMLGSSLLCLLLPNTDNKDLK